MTNPYTRARPAYEQKLLADYCWEYGITTDELAAAEAHAKVRNNALYTSRDGWTVGTGGEQSSEYERITLIEWVERYRAAQGAAREH